MESLNMKQTEGNELIPYSGIQGFDRNQLQMLSFDEFVKQDSWARIVDLFVD